MNNNVLDELLAALSESLSDEDLLLSVIQADIAATISSVRASKGISQAELAAALGVRQNLISRWESGDVNFTLKTLVKIALELGIKMESPYKPDKHPMRPASNNIVPFPRRAFYASSEDDTWISAKDGLPKEM